VAFADYSIVAASIKKAHQAHKALMDQRQEVNHEAAKRRSFTKA
jgi:hypothetical protein